MKRKLLMEILEVEEGPFIVFCNAKKTCDSLAKHLEGIGIKAIVIHGGKVQETRESNLEAFKAGKYDVLVATDVVGRGIDVKGVKQVVNYDLPKDIEKYTHRIGRTGRANETGVATSFVTAEDTEIMYHLREMLLQASAIVPPEMNNHEAARTKPGDVKKVQPKIIYSTK
jgi:ATP-dependent RNA helicase DDX23/PRP28